MSNTTNFDSVLNAHNLGVAPTKKKDTEKKEQVTQGNSKQEKRKEMKQACYVCNAGKACEVMVMKKDTVGKKTDCALPSFPIAGKLIAHDIRIFLLLWAFILFFRLPSHCF